MAKKKIIALVLDNGGFAVINKLQNNTGNESFNNLIKDPKENVHVIKAPPQGLVLTKVDYEIN